MTDRSGASSDAPGHAGGADAHPATRGSTPPGSSPSSAGGEAPRLALRSPVEVLLWIFLTRLMALVMPTRTVDATSTPDASTAGADAATDPGRAERVAASRRPTGGAPVHGSAATGPAGDDASTDRAPATSTRTIAVTAASALAAGAAAYAAGRRRGAR